MANRFSSPNQQFANSAGVPYAGGKLYFYASGTSTPLATYTNQALSTPNANPVILDSAGRAGNIFLQDLAYKVTLTDSADVQVWTADPVYSSDFSTIAQFTTTAGSPNGQLAGTAGSSGVPADACWDRTNNILYVCTTTGTSSTAVWTAVNAGATQNIIPTPQGYLTPVSGTPVIVSDSASATSVFYTPYVGSLIPIYNGSSFVPFSFSELTMTLSASQAANAIYDLFVFSNAGVPTLAVGPAWTTATAGSGARGTGAGTTQLTRISGIWVNAVSMTGRNGATTYSISANQATYVGSIFMDSVAGQVTCHRSYGQSRKWGIWNAYNRVPLYLKAGDATASWTYSTNTVRPSNNNTANSLSVFCGLAEEPFNLVQSQLIYAQTAASAVGGSTQIRSGLGWNSTTAYSGHVNENSVLATTNFGTPTILIGAGSGAPARLLQVPALGVNVVTSLESTPSVAGGSGIFTGTEASMVLSAQWRG